LTDKSLGLGGSSLKQGRRQVLPPSLCETAFKLFNYRIYHYYGVVVALVVTGVGGGFAAKLTRLATFVLLL
jgi:hypothetical protein